MSKQAPHTDIQPPAFKSTIEALLWAVDQYKAKYPGATDESIGWRAVRQSALIPRLRAGGDCVTRQRDALIRFMSSNPKKRK